MLRKHFQTKGPRLQCPVQNVHYTLIFLSTLLLWFRFLLQALFCLQPNMLDSFMPLFLHFFHQQVSLLHPSISIQQTESQLTSTAVLLKAWFPWYFVTTPTGSQNMSFDFLLGYLAQYSLTVIYSNNSFYSIPITIEITATINRKMFSESLSMYG